MTVTVLDPSPIPRSPRRPPLRSRNPDGAVVLGVVGVLAMLAGLVGPLGPTDRSAAAQAHTAPTYSPPTDAAAIDPFRRPRTRYGAGNRGVEYGTPAGGRVAAIGDGRVVFAGPVGGRWWITIEHPDGLRSSYGPMRSVLVAVGDEVGRGAFVGTTAGPLHLGVRAGSTYLDPQLLFGGVAPARVRLVAVPGSRPRGRRAGPPRRVDGVRATPAATLLRRLGAAPDHASRRSPVRDHPRSPLAAPVTARTNRWDPTRRRRDGPCRDHATAVGSGGALRAPDPALEPEDEAVHPR